jgi:hypothetical protein
MLKKIKKIISININIKKKNQKKDLKYFHHEHQHNEDLEKNYQHSCLSRQTIQFVKYIMQTLSSQ